MSSIPIPIPETFKKRKRRTPKLFDFDSFPESDSHNPTSTPFRDNIRSFLNQCAEPEEYSVHQGMPVWSTFLVHNKTRITIPLYTIEEDVNHSLNPYCNHCRFKGWSDHSVSKRKYHVVIPDDRDWFKPLDKDVALLNIHSSHLLHGLIHCNGFGHLFSINGIEGGSKYLCGREIMDLWDRICERLNASRISVEDVSWKDGLDLRLLHGVAYGHTWFGRWGYRFWRGSYGVTEQSYDSAIETLSSHELDRVILDFGDREQCGRIECMVQHYRDQSESQLVTVRDLFKFMLSVKSHSGAQKKPLPRITIRRGLTAKEASLGCRGFTSVMAHREYRWPAFKRKVVIREVPRKPPPYTDVYNDVVYLYNNILLSYPESESMELATQTVLDSKYFVKDWPFRDEDEKLLRLFCHVMPDSFDAENTLTEIQPPPGVLVMVPLHATVFDLKQAAEKALRDTYCIMDQLVVTEIDEMEDRPDELLGAVQSGEEVLFQGIGLDLDITNLRHEGGTDDNRMIRCKCGAWDDDGERMVECDVCEVWRHTRCCGIEDSESVPPLFVCPGCCCSALGPPLSDSTLAFRNSDDLLLCSENVYEKEFNYDNSIGLLTW